MEQSGALPQVDSLRPPQHVEPPKQTNGEVHTVGQHTPFSKKATASPGPAAPTGSAPPPGAAHDIEWDTPLLDILRAALRHGEIPELREPSLQRSALREAGDADLPFGVHESVTAEDVVQSFENDAVARHSAQVILSAQGLTEAELCAAAAKAAKAGEPMKPSTLVHLKQRQAWEAYIEAEGAWQVDAADALVDMQTARNAATRAEEELLYQEALAKRQASPSPAAGGKRPLSAVSSSLGGFRGPSATGDAGTFMQFPGVPQGARKQSGIEGQQPGPDLALAEDRAAAASALEAAAMRSVAEIHARSPSREPPPPTFVHGAALYLTSGPVLVLGSGTGHMSVALAQALTNTTIVSVAWPTAPLGSLAGQTSTPADLHVALKEILGVENNPVVEASVSMSFLGKLHSAHVPWSAVIVQDLPRLTGSLLPGEFEHLLGAILTLARRVVLPSPLPPTRFFSYWQDTAALVDAAAAAAGVVASARSVQRQANVYRLPGSLPPPGDEVLVIAVQTEQEAAAEDLAYAAAAAELQPSPSPTSTPTTEEWGLPASAGPASGGRGDPWLPYLDSDTCFSVDVRATLVQAQLPVLRAAAPAVLRLLFPNTHHVHVPSLVAAILSSHHERLQEPEPASSPEKRGAGRASPDSAQEHFVSPPDSSLLPPENTGMSKLAGPVAASMAVQAVLSWTKGVSLSVLRAAGLHQADVKVAARRLLLPMTAPGTAYFPPFLPPSHLLWSGAGLIALPPHSRLPVSVPAKVQAHVAKEVPLPSPSQRPMGASKGNKRPGIKRAAVPDSAKALDAAAMVGKASASAQPLRQQKVESPPPKEERAALDGKNESSKPITEQQKASKDSPPVQKAATPVKESSPSKSPASKNSHATPKAKDDVAKAQPRSDPSKSLSKDGTGQGPSAADKEDFGAPAANTPDKPKVKKQASEYVEKRTPAASGKDKKGKITQGEGKALRGGARRLLSLPDAAEAQRSALLIAQRGALAPDRAEVVPSVVLDDIAQALGSAAVDGPRSEAVRELQRMLPPSYAAAAAGATLNVFADEGADQAARLVGHEDAAWAHRRTGAGEGKRDANWADAWREEADAVHRREGAVLQAAWAEVSRQLDASRLTSVLAIPGFPAAWTALVSGASATSLASKLGRAYPQALVVAAHSGIARAETHQALSDLLNQNNVLPTKRGLTLDAIKELRQHPDPARLHITDASLLAPMVVSGGTAAVEAYLAQLLPLASTTMIIVPPWSVFLHAVAVSATAGIEDGWQVGPTPPCEAYATRDPAALLESLGYFGAMHPHAESAEAAATGVGVQYPYPGSAQAAVHDFSEAYDSQQPHASPPQAKSLGFMSLADFAGSYESSASMRAHSTCDFSAGAPCACASAGDSRQPYRNMLERAARAAGLGDSSTISIPSYIQLPGSSASCPRELLLLRVDVAAWATRSAPTTPPPPPVIPTSSVATLPSPIPGWSLHSLVQLGLTPSLSKDLLRLHLSLPLPDIAVAQAQSASLPPWLVRVLPAKDSLTLVVPVLRAEQGAGSGSVQWFQAERGAGPQVSGPAQDSRWEVLKSVLSPADTASGGQPGAFSYLELGAGAGAVALSVAAAFPKATVLSVEESRLGTDMHLAAALALKLPNAVICRHAVDSALLTALAKSPEMLRFLYFGTPLEELLASTSESEVRGLVSHAIMVGGTSVLRVPSAAHLSLAMSSLFPPSQMGEAVTFRLASHPTPRWAAAEWRLISELVDASVSSELDLRVSVLPAAKHARLQEGGMSGRTPGLRGQGMLASGVLGSGLVRVDIVNMTRHVNHHFQSEIDGHERKYTLNVAALPAGTPVRPGLHPNNGGFLDIHLTRDKDGAHIPYETVHGVTLIAVLRMGLLKPLRAQAYHQFVALPLYQDMAPWNIVFLGPALDYIDFDTKDHTYDALVPHIFEVMEVLFNYKRTVEDFKQCHGKAPVLYGFPFVSDCVASAVFDGPCKDNSRPVPCGDGKCHSDYISCLRALSDRDASDGHAGWQHSVLSTRLQLAQHQDQSLRQADVASIQAALSAREAPATSSADMHPAGRPGTDDRLKKTKSLEEGILRLGRGT